MPALTQFCTVLTVTFFCAASSFMVRKSLLIADIIFSHYPNYFMVDLQ